jgi:hypothetical protein
VEAQLARILVLLNKYPPAYTVELGEHSVVAAFGRFSIDLAQTVGFVCNATRARYLVISGGRGKDSGLLSRWGASEAHFILCGAVMQFQYALTEAEVEIDTAARNGLDNAYRLAELLQKFGFKGRNPFQLVVVAHSTQMLRLGATLTQVLFEAGLSFKSIRWVPSTYRPNLKRLQDQWEICSELVKLAEMQERGWVDLEIPPDLLAWAREYLPIFEQDIATQRLTCTTAGLRSF